MQRHLEKNQQRANAQQGKSQGTGHMGKALSSANTQACKYMLHTCFFRGRFEVGGHFHGGGTIQPTPKPLLDIGERLRQRIIEANAS